MLSNYVKISAALNVGTLVLSSQVDELLGGHPHQHIKVIA